MALIDLIKNVPDIGKETIELILKPRNYIINKQNNPSKYTSVEKTFLWLIAVSLLLLKMYSTVFMPIEKDVLKATPFKICSDTTSFIKTVEETKVNPTIEQIVWWSPGFGVGLNFPDPCKPSNVPQYCIFNVGGLYAIIKDLKPDQFNQTGFSAFILLTLGLVLTLCIYPSMRVLNKKTDFKELLKYSILFISSYFFAAICLAVITATVCIHLLSVNNWPFYFIWLLFVLMPLLVFIFRGYFTAYSQLFDTSKGRLFSGSIISLFLSWIISPLVFAPLLYIALWLIPLYDLIVK